MFLHSNIHITQDRENEDGDDEDADYWNSGNSDPRPRSLTALRRSSSLMGKNESSRGMLYFHLYRFRWKLSKIFPSSSAPATAPFKLERGECASIIADTIALLSPDKEVPGELKIETAKRMRMSYACLAPKLNVTRIF